jgi:hypothetical protein
MAMAFLGLDITNTKLQVDHIDRIRNNNNINNLRIVTNSQNMFNINAKGVYKHSQANGWFATICINYKKIYLGYFDTEEEAHAAYIEAKAKHHIINPHPPQL